MDNRRTSFEEEFRKLSEASSAMEQAGLSLSDKITLYREGAEAAKRCLSILGQAETDVDHISEEIEAMLQEGGHVEGHTENKTDLGE